MDVANLDLCKELYELSGWGDATLDDMLPLHPDWREVHPPNPKLINFIPAYDLGYLLRKLRYANTKAYIKADQKLEQLMMSERQEDYAASWLIELFKQGILK